MGSTEENEAAAVVLPWQTEDVCPECRAPGSVWTFWYGMILPPSGMSFEEHDQALARERILRAGCVVDRAVAHVCLECRVKFDAAGRPVHRRSVH